MSTIEDVKKVISKMEFVSPIKSPTQLKQHINGKSGKVVADVFDEFLKEFFVSAPEIYTHLNKLVTSGNNQDVLFDCKLFLDDLNAKLKDFLQGSDFEEMLVDQREKNHK